MSAKRKPMTIDSVLAEDETPQSKSAIRTPEAERNRSGGQRSHVKQLTMYLPHAVYRQLRELAFHEERRMHSLLMEGLDRVFSDRGVPSSSQLSVEADTSTR